MTYCDSNEQSSSVSRRCSFDRIKRVKCLEHASIATINVSLTSSPPVVYTTHAKMPKAAETKRKSAKAADKGGKRKKGIV